MIIRIDSDRVTAQSIDSASVNARHVTETELDDVAPDATVRNDGSRDDLARDLILTLTRFLPGAVAARGPAA